jgi:hypothetical protein
MGPHAVLRTNAITHGQAAQFGLVQNGGDWNGFVKGTKNFLKKTHIASIASQALTPLASAALGTAFGPGAGVAAGIGGQALTQGLKQSGYGRRRKQSGAGRKRKH